MTQYRSVTDNPADRHLVTALCIASRGKNWTRGQVKFNQCHSYTHAKPVTHNKICKKHVVTERTAMWHYMGGLQAAAILTLSDTITLTL